MRSIGISAKITSADALEYASRTAGQLRDRGFQICFDDKTSEALGLDDSFSCVPKTMLAGANDLLITFGGDGTLLSVARHASHDVPIIGVNMGTLGFLTEDRVEDFPEGMERV